MADTQDSRAYSWFIACMYAAAIGINIYVIYDQVKDAPEGEAIRKRARQVSERVRQHWHFPRMARQVVREAEFEVYKASTKGPQPDA